VSVSGKGPLRIKLYIITTEANVIGKHRNYRR
jgi:hypothetical protein